jgi:hypothetical protein
MSGIKREELANQVFLRILFDKWLEVFNSMITEAWGHLNKDPRWEELNQSLFESLAKDLNISTYKRDELDNLFGFKDDYASRIGIFTAFSNEPLVFFSNEITGEKRKAIRRLFSTSYNPVIACIPLGEFKDIGTEEAEAQSKLTIESALGFLGASQEDDRFAKYTEEFEEIQRRLKQHQDEIERLQEQTREVIEKLQAA